MKTVQVSLYSFNELSEAAKEAALIGHANFLMSLPLELEDNEGELSKYYNLEYSREEIIDNIIANEYLFFADGNLAHCTTYTGKHEKSGITEFHFHGQTFDITNS